MDISRLLIEHRPIDIGALRAAIATLPKDFWRSDQVTRTAVAGDRPGNAVFFYNDNPVFSHRSPLKEVAATGSVSVLRNVTYPCFELVEAIISEYVAPLYPSCDAVRVQLAELPPGAEIKPHRDFDILAAMHRLHVPIVTNAGVTFTIDGKFFSLAEGVLYELNNAVEHAVHNRGDTTRVHLLLDMLPNALGRAAYFDRGKDMLVSMLKTGAHRIPVRRK